MNQNGPGLINNNYSGGGQNTLTEALILLMPRTQKETSFFAGSITIFHHKNRLKLQNNHDSQKFLPNLR